MALSQKYIHYKIIKLIILKLLLSATPLLAHYELPREIDLMMIEHDLNKCSKGKIDSYFFHKEKAFRFELFKFSKSGSKCNSSIILTFITSSLRHPGHLCSNFKAFSLQVEQSG